MVLSSVVQWSTRAQIMFQYLQSADERTVSKLVRIDASNHLVIWCMHVSMGGRVQFAIMPRRRDGHCVALASVLGPG